jgi:hypothetical protein
MVSRPRWLLAVLFWVFTSSLARADSYEAERTQRVLDRHNLEIEAEPEGKRIAFIRIVRDDVFVKDEIWPTWFNWFHGTTRESIVRRELLFGEGLPYVHARIEETMRNLRGMGIFALVRIVAVKTTDPNAIGVVVHTRDIWSLRLEEDFNVTTRVNYLLLRLTERNLFGHNQTVGADFTLLPKNYLVREFYSARRLWGSTVRFAQTGGVYFNREHNKAEGSELTFSLGEPYYNLKQRFAWTVDFSNESRVVRYTQNGQIIRYQPMENGPSAQKVWRQLYRTGGVGAYYRRGHAFKQTFGAGWDYRALNVNAIAESMVPPELMPGFKRDVLPKERTENGPFASYEIWMPSYVTFVNLGTFGQSENVRVGPYASASVRAPLSEFGSTTHSWVVGSTVGFVLAPGGGLFEAKLSGSERYEYQKLVDQLFTAMVRGATPVISKFRLVGRVVLESRRRDTSKSLVSLGANNGLRGYTSQSLYGIGASRALANFELRTLPLQWQAVHLGGVIFYDVGSVFDRFADMRFHHAVGVGIRFLFPQFNRYPFTLDGGMSADPDFRFVPTFTTGQVVPLTAIEDG